MELKILSKGILKDGGSICYNTTRGKYLVDNRIGTQTRGAIYRNSFKPDNLSLKGEELEIKSLIAAFENRCCKKRTCKK